MCAIARAERAHRERHDVERAPAHRAGEQLAQLGAHRVGVAPVVGRPGVLAARAADERAVLDARDVARIGARPVGVGPQLVVQAHEGARGDEAGGELLVLLLGAVAPVHALGLEHAPPTPRPTRAEPRARSVRKPWQRARTRRRSRASACPNRHQERTIAESRRVLSASVARSARPVHRRAGRLVAEPLAPAVARDREAADHVDQREPVQEAEGVADHRRAHVAGRAVEVAHLEAQQPLARRLAAPRLERR